MTIIGYFVSISVFADSGFVILSPLNKALSKEAKISLTSSTVALAMGLIATYYLVPPMPVSIVPLVAKEVAVKAAYKKALKCSMTP